MVAISPLENGSNGCLDRDAARLSERLHARDPLYGNLMLRAKLKQRSGQAPLGVLRKIDRRHAAPQEGPSNFARTHHPLPGLGQLLRQSLGSVTA